MSNQSFDENGVQFIWDATSISLAMDCPRKYYYVMYEGWVSKSLSVHLKFGGHYATALEHYHLYLSQGMSKDEALRKVIREALIDTWNYDQSSIENTNSELLHNKVKLTGGSPWVSGDSRKTRETLIRTIIWYVETFEDKEIKTVILSDGSPAVEYGFLLSVDDDLFFAGHIDRLVKFGDAVYVMDQKTTGGTLTSNYFNQFSPP